jgi:hypothetical protein
LAVLNTKTLIHIEYFCIRTEEIQIVRLDNTSRSKSTSCGPYTCETSIQKQCEGTDIDPDHSVLVAKIHTKLKKIIKFQKGGGEEENKVGSGEVTGSTTESASYSE